MGRAEGLDRDIDALFLGSVGSARPERTARLGELRAALDERGIRLHVSDGDYFGEARARLLNRSKVIVNLRSNSWHPELVRFVLAAMCGTAIVSDLPGTDTDPFVSGRHFVAVEGDELANAITELVLDDARRSVLTLEALQLVQTELTMAHVAQEFLGLVNPAGR